MIGSRPLTALLLVPLALTGCSAKQRVRTETTLADIMISDQQSQQIGLQVREDLDKQGVRYIKDPEVLAYVDGIAARIFPLARKDRPGVDFSVKVIDDPNTVNAFATPGGYLYLYSGLLLAADNEAEVAGVLAHEAGHVVGRHVERQMVSSYGLQAIASMAIGSNPSLAQEIAASIASTGLMRAHGRSEEIEADEYGARYSARAGYDPHAMITFFGKLGAMEQKTPGMLGWLRTHPTSRARIDNLKGYIADHHLHGTELDAARHQQIRRRLSQGG